MNTIETLNALKSCFNDASDYRIAQLMGISRSRVSNWRRGLNTMDAAARIQAANLLNQDPALHLLYMELERTDDPQVITAWKSALQKVAATATAVIIGLSATLAPAPADANPALDPGDNDPVCILCQITGFALLLHIIWIFTLLFSNFG